MDLLYKNAGKHLQKVLVKMSRFRNPDFVNGDGTFTRKVPSSFWYILTSFIPWVRNFPP